MPIFLSLSSDRSHLPKSANISHPLAALIEFRTFLLIYALSLPLQILTTGSVLRQNSLAIVILTAIHAGVVAALFWSLLYNGILLTQLFMDGTAPSLIVHSVQLFRFIYY